MGLKIKTLNGSVILKKPPNGGWGWVVTLSAFFCGGIAFGSTKSFGVFFIDIKNEFGASNASISWFMSLFVSVITVSGVLPHILSRWLDARQVIMIGGLIGSTGLVVCAISPVMAVMYFGSIITGVGYGIMSICSLSQVSFYFSTLKPLANGIALCGSTSLGSLYPYLNQHLLDSYNWRGAFLILAAVNLNACCAGALVHPISPCADLEDGSNTLQKLEQEAHCSSQLTQLQDKSGKKNNDANGTTKFLKKYWLGFCFLFVNTCVGLSMYVPNIYIIPHALTNNISKANSTMLLSLLSVGDFLGRLMSGVVISSFKSLSKHIVALVAALILVCSVVQIIPLLSTMVPELAVYSTLYGCTFGSVTTSSITSISQLVEPRIMPLAFGLFFTSGGVALFISGLVSGLLVDWFGTFLVVFWYTLICMAMTGMLMGMCAFALQKRGGKIVK